jgi:cytidylate kinase
MSLQVVVERITEALSRAQKDWQSARREADQEPQTQHYSIAIAREAGTPGSAVAHEIGTRLGWVVYGHELVERIAHEMGVRVSLVESLDEKRQHWLRESLQALGSGPPASEAAYVHRLSETILSLGAHGRSVIIGRGAAQILPAQTTLRVRLIGPREERIAHAMRQHSLTHREASHWIDATDRERRRFVRSHFQKDPAEPGGYDLTLNAFRWSVRGCAEVVIESLRCMERERTVNAG